MKKISNAIRRTAWALRSALPVIEEINTTAGGFDFELQGIKEPYFVSFEALPAILEELEVFTPRDFENLTPEEMIYKLDYITEPDSRHLREVLAFSILTK